MTDLDNFREPEPPRQTAPYLKGPDGYIYVWTDLLALRGDMVPCYELPDSFKKEQNYNDNVPLKDIRFMKKEEVIEEARVKWGFTFPDDMTAKKMKPILRKLRKGEKI